MVPNQLTILSLPLEDLSDCQLIGYHFSRCNYTHEEAIIFMDILDGRYAKGSIIVTSQIDNLGWSKLFEDPAIGETIIDRLVHPSQKILLKGGSYRERIQNERRAKT